MASIKKILVAVASTDYCQGIVDYAATLAVGLDAEILVVSVVNARDVNAVRQVADMGYAVDGEHYAADVKQRRQAEIEAMVQRTTFPRERIQISITVGNPIDELLRCVLEASVDLVVMGTKGRTDLEHILMGSVAEKMFRRCPVSVVSYRDPKQAEKLRRRINSAA